MLARSMRITVPMLFSCCQVFELINTLNFMGIFTVASRCVATERAPGSCGEKIVQRNRFILSKSDQFSADITHR